jgi:hypothetical protein
VEKRGPRICATLIFNKLAKENNRLIGENSPNLVTQVLYGRQGDQMIL